MNIKHLQKTLMAFALLAGLTVSASVSAQSVLDSQYPQLGKLFDAFTVTHATALDTVAEINADPRTAQARQSLLEELEMAQQMDHHQMMAMGHGGHGSMDMDMGMNMSGPYGEIEAEARVILGRMTRGEHADEAVASAYRDSNALPTHAAVVLDWGRQFELAVWNIWADPAMSVAEKAAATEVAVSDYRSGDEIHAVTLEPQPVELYLDQDYAQGMKVAFPRINGLLWANQWLQLAALEAVIVGQVDPQFANRVDVTLERYSNKLGSDSGMSMFPPPSELPTAPAIAPSLYTQAPQAAVIMDNLNMLEAAINDIVAYPNLDADTREQAILEKVEQFTTSMETTDSMNYLLSALRGGIYNQGGPALGELSGSERNRSREAMNMQHTMIMSSPQ